MEFIDTHSHLFTEEFDADSDQVIRRAFDSRVRKILLPNIDVDSISRLKSFSSKFADISFPMMGIHPCSINQDYLSQLSLIKEELFSSTKYFGVGEIGLDYYWDKTFIEQQRDAFKQQCQWAVQLNLGVSIHTRNATYDAIAILKQMKQRPRGVFHCFSGSLEEAKEIINLGFKLGIGGVLTYKNANLPDVLKSISIEHLVLETDSPYLPPVPFRGKRNESSYISYIAEKLAEVYNMSVESVAIQTSANAISVFKL